MKRVPVPLATLSLLLSALLMNGCFLTKHWIEGKWKFDAERSRAANATTSQGQGDAGSFLAKVKGLVGGAVEGIMTSSLETAVIEFTPTEIRTTQGDSGTSVPYKIINKPDANTVVIQKEAPTGLIQKEGKKIETYHRDGAGIWFKPSETLDFKIYLKRAS